MKINPLYAWALIVVGACGVLAMAVNLQSGFFALLFALIGWWAFQNEEEALLYFIVLAPLLPMLKMTQTIGTFTLAKDVIIIVLFLKAFLIPLLEQRLPYRRNVFLLPLLMLIGYVIIAFLMADSLTLGILRAREIGLYILLYISVLYMPFSKEIFQRRLVWLASSAGVLLLAAVYQWVAAPDSAVLRFDPARSIWIPRISSTFAHPSVFGEYLILLSSLAGSIAALHKKWRWWGILSLLILLPFVYLTYSRGVWLGYVLAALLCGVAYISRYWAHAKRVRYMGKRIVSAAVGFLVAFAIIFTVTPVGTFIRSSFDPAYASNQIRLEFLARLVANTNNTQALFGHGLGDIDQKALKSVDVGVSDITQGDSRDVQLAKDSTLVDNQYLKTFIEMGLAGILIYIWIYKRAIMYSWKLAHYDVLGLAALGFFASFIIQALFVDIWDVFPTNAIFWIMAAMVSQQSLSKRYE